MSVDSGVYPQKGDALEEYGIVPGTAGGDLGLGIDRRSVRAAQPR